MLYIKWHPKTAFRLQCMQSFSLSHTCPFYSSNWPSFWGCFSQVPGFLLEPLTLLEFLALLRVLPAVPLRQWGFSADSFQRKVTFVFHCQVCMRFFPRHFILAAWMGEGLWFWSLTVLLCPDWVRNCRCTFAAGISSREPEIVQGVGVEVCEVEALDWGELAVVLFLESEFKFAYFWLRGVLRCSTYKY